MKFGTKIESKIFIISIIFVITYYFLPLLKSGLIGDDSYNAQIKGRLFYENINIFDFYLRETLAWYWNNGRLFPLSLFMYFIFYLINEPIIIKSFYFILIIINLTYFFKIIKYFTNSKKLGLLFCILVATSIQLRLWHDPVLSFHGLMQTLLLFFLISIYYFLKNKKKINNNYHKISLFFYFLSLITYEISYCFIGLFFFLDYFKTNSFKESIINIKHYIYIFLIILFIVLAAKIKIFITQEPSYPLIESSFNFLNILKALFVQFFSSLNLSYTAGHIYMYGYSYLKENISVYDLFFLTLTFFVLQKTLNFSRIKNLKEIVLISLWLWLLPALLVSLSGHQNELIKFGLPAVGYIPIYLQYYGTIIILYLIFNSIVLKLDKFNNFFKYAAIIILTISAYLHTLTNREVVKYIDNKYEIERNNLKTAFKSGLLDELKDGDLIIREMNKPHDWIWFYALYAKKKLVFCDYENYRLEFCYPFHDFNKIRDKKNSKKVFYLYHGQNKYNQDYDIFVGEIKDINLHIKNLNRADLYNMKYFDLSNDKIIKLKSIGKNKILNYDLSKIDLLLSQIKN
tara:strand:+ start:1523 stop:3235 length:1713 start_codon:yes stop_codon:yes gene_type:complete